MAYRKAPFTGNATDGYEVTLATGDMPNGDPTDGSYAEGTAIFADPDAIAEVAARRRGPREVMIQSQFTGAGKATADWVCVWWTYNPDAEKWYPSAQFNLTHPSAGSATKGGVAIVDNDPNSSHGYLEVISGNEANQSLLYIVTAHTW